MPKKLTYSEERIREALNYTLTPQCTEREANAIMAAAAVAMVANNRTRQSNADEAHRNKVATVAASGDMAALRKLANANLAKRR